MNSRVGYVRTVTIAFSLFCASVSAQQAKIDESFPHMVVLPKSAAQELRHMCSRPGVTKPDASWEPTKAEVEGAESQLSMIPKLAGNLGRGGKCCEVVVNPARYYRQYIGIVVGGRKLIYLNAFLVSKNGTPFDWRSGLVSFCDGGAAFWGVMYDPETHKFTHLESNGFL